MTRWLPLAVGFYGALAAAAWVWRSAVLREPLLYASEVAAQSPLHPLRDAIAGLAAAGLLIGSSRLLTRRSAAGQVLAAELSTALGPLSPGAVIALALASGIGEELFFRGALQPRVGLWLASGLFALAHLLPSWPLALWSAFAFGAGVLFGLLFEGTGNLLAPVLGHVLTNAVNLRWLAKRYALSAGQRS